MSAARDSKGKITMKPWIFPSILITFDILAGIVYAFHGDWRRLIYWLAAATLTATVTF